MCGKCRQLRQLEIRVSEFEQRLGSLRCFRETESYVDSVVLEPRPPALCQGGCYRQPFLSSQQLTLRYTDKLDRPDSAGSSGVSPPWAAEEDDLRVSISTEDRQGSSHMEKESGTVGPQHTGEEWEGEGVSPRASTARGRDSEDHSRCMLFTYFEGDINSVVDEHFSRALKRHSSPINVSAKRKSESMGPKTDEKVSTKQWAPAAPLWSSPYPGRALLAGPRNAARVTTATAQYRPNALHALRPPPRDPWLLPAVSGQSLSAAVYRQPIPELHRMMPSAISNRQYSSLLVPLQGERAAAGPSQRHTVPKTNLMPTWADTGPGLAEMGPSLNPDIGLQHVEKRKDLYWY
uniref:transcription cofactor vestigial-like protein 3 n=1 Tax=Pristiophorus japonicus TaxID=55135 RepID=UPI00398F4543